MKIKNEQAIIRLLKRRRLTIALAESCTGGLISSSLTNVSGSSQCFLGSIIAYANKTKINILNVKSESIKQHGAVSSEVAAELASNVKKLLLSHIGLGITGIAGPTGGTKAKPVGTVFIAIAIDRKIYFKKYKFKGPRLTIKKKSKDEALKFLYQCLTQ